MPLTKMVVMGVGLGLVIAAAATLFVLLTRGRDVPTAPQTSATQIPATGASAQAPVARMPAAVHRPRPESGTELLSLQRSGGGSLVVNNAARRDAVVALATATGHERAVYVRAGEQVTLANVATGTYRVQMMVGRDWDTDRFTREAGYQELEQPVQFVEKSDGNSTEYTKLTVSLQAVVTGMRGIRTTRPFHISPQQEER